MLIHLKRSLSCFCLGVVTLASNPVALLAQTPTSVKVGVAGAAPFVMQSQQGQLTGISLDVWQEVAQRIDVDSQLIPYTNLSDAFEAVAKKEIDVLIGPISITPKRIELGRFKFTQPYFVVNMGLLLPEKPPTLWSRLTPFFGIATLSSVALLILLLFIVGNLIWLAERRRNEQFSSDYLSGVRNGMWFAIVTLTTVGYGDRFPITNTGRFIASIWMLITLVGVSSMTAGLASAFTTALSQTGTPEKFQTVEDLRGASIAVVANTTGADWADYYQARVRATSSLTEAIELLNNKQVEGVIFDRPALRYYLVEHPDLDFKVSPLVIASESYGFVLPLNSPLERSLNANLLEAIYNKRLHEISQKWLTNNDAEQ